MLWCSLEKDKAQAQAQWGLLRHEGWGNKEGRLVRIQFLPHREQTLSTMKTRQLMMLRKTITGNWIYHKKHCVREILTFQ
jgi:hypothetical protein